MSEETTITPEEARKVLEQEYLKKLQDCNIELKAVLDKYGFEYYVAPPQIQLKSKV